MAYVDPNTVQNAAAGAPLQAARLDADRDALEYLARNKPHCRAYNSANLSIANSTATVVTLNSERFDVGGCHSTSSNTGRLTVPSGEGGKYHIFGHVSWATNGTGHRQVYIRLNGSTILVVDTRMPVTTGIGTEQGVSTIYSLAAGDYVEMVVTQTSGGSLNLDSQSAYSPEFGMMWVGI